MDKLQIALISICVGWGLSQLTEIVKWHCKKKKLKSVISDELQELTELLNERSTTAKTSSLAYGHDGKYICSLGAPISTPVIDSFYSEVADRFTRAQRYNIRVLRDQIRAYNSIVEWIERNSSGSATQNEIVFKLFEAYKQTAFAHVYIKAANESGGKEKIGDDHEKLNSLRDTFIELTPKLAFKS